MQPGCSFGDAAARLVGSHHDIGDRKIVFVQEPSEEIRLAGAVMDGATDDVDSLF